MAFTDSWTQDSTSHQQAYKTRCVTRTLLRLSATMAPACARPASPETTPPGPSSPPLSDVPATRVSWSVWDRRTPTSVTRPSPRGDPVKEGDVMDEIPEEDTGTPEVA